MLKAASPPRAHYSRLAPIDAWFEQRGIAPFPFQRRSWSAYLEGESGLIHAPTGMGKSLAAFLGPVAEFLSEPRSSRGVEPLRVLWVTPMRALATDTTRALTATVQSLELPWRVEKRTGDTSHARKVRQRERLPTVLVTTPESLTLLLSYPGSRELFATLGSIVVDEWHELLSTKRGVQTELALARLRRWTPQVTTWGLSATLGNLEEALDALLGATSNGPTQLIAGDAVKSTQITTIIPESVDRFPWSGHLGLRLLPETLAAIESARTTLLFTNTRSQTEIWFRAILKARPEWVGQIALHHGSLDAGLRRKVEDLLREGALRCVVCTSSLDLGVDFSPVEQVIQVGSPKGVARLLQRAGRSGHQPGAISRAVCVPTQALELLEFAAARSAALAADIEPRPPLARPLDVLAQHLVTIACAGPFVESELRDEVRSTRAFRDLTDNDWRWCLDFVTRGGPALTAYPQYARIRLNAEGAFEIASKKIQTMHRLMVGAISSDAAITVRVVGGRSLGTIEESFVARLAPGDRFVFAGHILELVRVRDMTAHVRKTTRVSGIVPRWGGSRTPLSSQLAHAVRALIRDSAARCDEPEVVAARPLLELQAQWSRLPLPGALLIERAKTRDGHHAFLFPLEGRQVHEGLGTLLAHRLTRSRPITISVTVNDYGIELLSRDELPDSETDWRALLDEAGLLDDLMTCLNASQLARRQFRDIARVAGLIFPGFPGARGGGRTARQLQASSDLFFDVFAQFDPESMLLDQARREVLDDQLEVSRLRGVLLQLSGQSLTIVHTEMLTPFAFPIWAERMRTQHLTSERWIDRVQKMALRLEQRADRSARAQKAVSRRKKAVPPLAIAEDSPC